MGYASSANKQITNASLPIQGSQLPPHFNISSVFRACSAFSDEVEKGTRTHFKIAIVLAQRLILFCHSLLIIVACPATTSTHCIRYTMIDKVSKPIMTRMHRQREGGFFHWHEQAQRRRAPWLLWRSTVPNSSQHISN